MSLPDRVVDCADFDRFIAARRALLDEQLTAIDITSEVGGLLPDMSRSTRAC